MSCGALLAPFDIAELREITAYDELELGTLGDIAGHADVHMTMNCYVHRREEKIIEANDLIGGSFTAL